MNATETPPLFDPAEVARAITVLADPESVFEIRVLDGVTRDDRRPATHTGFFNATSAEQATKTLGGFVSWKSAYITLNAVDPQLLGRAYEKLRRAEKNSGASDKDITRRRWLLVDIDPRRPADISSSDDEHQEAIEAAGRVADALNADGWPDPIVCDSGNGAHLLYRIDLAADDGGLVERVVNAMDSRFSQGANHVDTSVHNAGRITKLYGTLNCKGDRDGYRCGRPWRLSKLLSVPETVQVVTREQLEALATAFSPKPKEQHKPSTSTWTGDRFDLPGFLAKHGIAHRGAESFEGGYRYVLEECPFNPEHKKRDSAVFQRADGSLGFKCFHDSCSAYHWQEFREKFEPRAERQQRRDEWSDRQNDSPATSNVTRRQDSRQGAGDQVADESAPEPPAFTRLMTCAELLEKDLTINFLVDDMLVEGQPCVIGGASKSLKTSITVDLAVSLATGAPFLGEFQTQQRRVAIWSGESGAVTLRSTAKRVAKSREIDLRQADLLWSFDLPKLSRADHLAELERTIIDKGLHVVIIDPLYLSLIGADDAGSAGNLYAMGARLFPLSEIGQRTGCTMVVLHHCRKARQGESVDSMSLESLSQSGISEWARQWIMLKRRSDYQFDGRHELWMQAGGSAGHSGQWGVDVNEGTMNKGAEDGGRFWEIEVRSHQEITEETADRRTSGRDENKRIREESRVQEDASKIVKFLKLRPNGETRSGIKAGASLTSPRSTAALLHLEGRGEVEPVSVPKNGRDEDGFRYVPPERRSGHVAADFGHGGRVASFDSWNDEATNFDQ